jgi:hypothetical protein
MSYEIPEPIEKLIEVFTQSLAGVQFPGADAALLERAATAARAAADRLAEAEAAVDAARKALDEAEGELVHKAQRALAYARIYAEEQPALAALLDGVVLRRDATVDAATEPRKRGRPRTLTAATPLFALREVEADAPGPIVDAAQSVD